MSNDSWQTPDDLFQVLDKGGVYQGMFFEGFHFDIDLCATAENSKCQYFCVDYLINAYLNKDCINGWTPGRIAFDEATKKDNITCFMNPPYSNPWPFIEKAWEDSKYCKIVCLVKVDTSTNWWSVFWDTTTCTYCGSSGGCYDELIGEYSCQACHGKKQRNGSKPGCDVIFFPKRIKFIPPEGINGKSGPSFPSCLVIMDRRGR